MKGETFAALFQEYQTPLYRYLFRMCGSKEIAEELLQETFYRAMLSLRLEQTQKTRAWLYRVARNLYIDWYRKQRFEKKLVQDIEQETTGVATAYRPEEELLKRERRAQIERIMRQLPERMRAVLYLREIEEFSYLELAETLELTLSQVKVTLHRSREKFRQLEQEARHDR